MRFTIVTPAFNSELHIVETIESVLSQKGDFEIEYILADGGSSDTTVSIFKDYQSRVERGEYPIQCNRIHMRSFSEKDRGMYDAIDKGLKLGTGELQAWINSDDYYLPGAFEMVAKIFNSFPDVAWLSGITEVIAADGSVSAPRRPLYTQTWLARGLYGTVAPFVLQDSVFWRSDLYQTAGPLPVTCRYAGDYGLWVSFAQTAQLWSFPVAVD
jgi:glycosyltransferase involved in cell wall biosynthesis